MAILNNSNAISTAGGYDINNSLRFRASASATLSRTPASASNQKTWTYSAWVKKSAIIDSGNRMGLFGIGPQSAGAGYFCLAFANTASGGADTLIIDRSGVAGPTSTAVYRDCSAWYHVVFAVNTTLASNRVRVYVNGIEITAWSASLDTVWSQNTDTLANSTNQHRIGQFYQNSEYFDGYLAEVNFIDGQALTPSSFGETDTTTGSWKPKAYTSTYGTNGFYLKFSDIATTSGSNAGLGKDFSGNTNYWTTNNISVTAGTTYDAMIDSPTLTSATVSNYCTLNPVLQNAYWAGPNRGNIINGNLTLSQNNGTAFSTFDVNTSGKWYLEATVTTYGQGASPSAFIISAVSRATFECNYLANGQKQLNGAVTSAYGSSWTTGDIIGIAIDPANNQITYYKNGTSQGAITQTFPSQTLLVGYYAEATGTDVINFNFGQRPFSYTPPTGFVRLNTYNLPDSTIKKGNSYFDAVTYNGSNSNLTVTNAGSFQPDLVWAKSRSGAYNNILVDAIRGGNLYLSSNTTAADTTSTGLATFTSSGITWIGGASGVNASGDTYVDWMWKGGNGTSSNTSGSITSTVSVSTTAGFSVVTYTGTGSAATIGHGLGVAPRMIICKSRGATGDWVTYHASIGAGNALFLNLTDASVATTAAWNNTAPTSSVFSVAASANSNPSGVTCVAYCWAEIAGFSKFGSYTGNGSTDGPFVYTGFRPKFVIFKRTDTVADWVVEDTARSTYNVIDARLFPNTSDAEVSNGNGNIDYLSNGFKLRNSHTAMNASGGTYIYMAFAENPFKNSLAR